MKRFLYILMLVAIAMAAYQVQPAISGEPKGDNSIIGSWIITQNSTDSSGNTCPFVPESFVFFDDQTMMMPSFGSQPLPFKISVTPEERLKIEKRVPELKGKNFLLIKPNPNLDWTSTPMVYAYVIDKNELTLTIQGWSPAKFVRVNK